MSQQEDKIRKLFQDKIEGIDTPPPQEIWDGIENELFPKKKERPFIWWFMAAAFVGGLSIYFLLPGNSAFNVREFSAEQKKNQTESQEKFKSENSNPKIRTFENSGIQTNPSDNKQLINDKTVSQNKVNKTNPSQVNHSSNASAANHQKTNKTNNANNHTSAKSNKSDKFFKQRGDEVAQDNSSAKGSKNAANQDSWNPKTNGVSGENSSKPGIDGSAQKNPNPEKIHNNQNSQALLADSNSLKNKNTPTPNKLGSSSSIASNKKDSIEMKNTPNLSQIHSANDSTPKINSDPPKNEIKTSPPPTTKKHFLAFGAALGREIRNYKINDDIHANHSNLVDRDVTMRYRGLGISYQYQFNSAWVLGVGLLAHRNRFTTRLFPIRIANDKLDEAYQFSSSAGELKSSPLDLTEYANTNQDTTVFLGRIIHRSAFLSIPLTMRWTTNNNEFLNFYVQAGLQVNFKMRELNTIVIRNSAFERSFDSQRLRNRQFLAPSGLIALGVSAPMKRKTQWFGELTYAQYLGNYDKGNFMTITSKNVYLNIGLRIELNKMHLTQPF